MLVVHFGWKPTILLEGGNLFEGDKTKQSASAGDLRNFHSSGLTSLVPTQSGTCILQ